MQIIIHYTRINNLYSHNIQCLLNGKLINICIDNIELFSYSLFCSYCSRLVEQHFNIVSLPSYSSFKFIKL